jgi:hypothetical protein
MFSRYLARIQRILQGGDIKPENGHQERENNGREEVEILCGFIEGWWVLEDGEAAGAEGHQVEPWSWVLISLCFMAAVMVWEEER